MTHSGTRESLEVFCIITYGNGICSYDTSSPLFFYKYMRSKRVNTNGKSAFFLLSFPRWKWKTLSLIFVLKIQNEPFQVTQEIVKSTKEYSIRNLGILEDQKVAIYVIYYNINGKYKQGMLFYSTVR